MKISAAQIQTIPMMDQAGRRHDACGLVIRMVFLLFLLPACVAYAPVPAPAVYYRVSSYRVAWENAQRAAEDVGIRITSADEGSGTIEGQADRTAVTISVIRLPD